MEELETFFIQKLKQTNETIYKWKSIIMHLPYAFQGRRMLSEIYALDSKQKNNCRKRRSQDYQNKLREISKSDEYKDFVAEKLMPAELASSLVGNLYTGSIFMGLLSTLAHFHENDKEISGTFGFLA
jgi:hydroxymethylglutaryl-CoA synthase